MNTERKMDSTKITNINPKAKARQSNFEVLRILAMLMIISHHLAFHGVQHSLADAAAYEVYGAGSFINKLTVSLLNPGGQIGVALFFMITGYFHIQKKQVSILKVVLESVFYGLFSVIFFVVVKLFLGGFSTLGTADGFQYLLKIIFNPATGGAWWFVAVYIVLMLISPLLNEFLLKLNKKGFLLFIIVAWVMWYSIACAIGATFFNLERGIFFYMIGGYCKLYGTSIKGTFRRLLNVVAIAIGWIICALIFYKYTENFGDSFKIKMLNHGLNIVHSSVGVIFCSICIFRLFQSMDMGTKKIINLFSGTTLGIYMIHDSLIVRSFVWHDLLKVDTKLYTQHLFPLYAVLTVIMIFIVCSLIDLIRIKCIEPKAMARVQKVIKLLEKRYVKNEK